MNQLTVKSTGFNMQPANMSEAMEVAQMLSGSSVVPNAYQNKPQDTLVAMMMGSELGLNPIKSLQSIAVINGTPAMYGDAMLALVQCHPAYEWIKEEFDEANMAAVCTIKRKNSPEHIVRFSQADATQANLWGRKGPWSQYPKRMLQMRARGFALRDQFADALGGLITYEEARDIPQSEPVDMGEAQVVEPQHYPQGKFDANFEKWQQMITTGKSTSQKVIAKIESVGLLTDEQKQQIEKIGA